MKNEINRSDFLRGIWVGISASILTSCKHVALPSPSDTQTPSPNDTEIPSLKPTETIAITPTRQPTISPTPYCLDLINPIDGSTVPAVGKIRFSWEEYPSAEKYLFELMLPNKTIIPLGTTSNTYRDQYLDPLGGGDYEWYVSALDIEGNIICISEPRRFIKSSPVLPSGNAGGSNSGSSEKPQPTLKTPQTENQ